MPITFQGGQTLPTQGTSAYKALQNSPVSGAGNFNPESQEVSVLSSQRGTKVLNAAVDKHNGDMASLTPAPTSTTTPETPKPPTISDTSKEAIKAQGGLTADEAKATGIDVTKLTSDYNYDTTTGYYVPKNQDVISARNDYKADTDKVNSAFSLQIAGMDAATQNIIFSLNSIYSDRIRAQQDVNARELQGFNTMNIRGGTSRYAGGVAQSILTADENAGLQRIMTIANEQANKIAEAQQNLTDKKYTAFLNNRQEVDKLTADYKNTVKDLNDKALTAQKDKRDYDLNIQKFQETKDQNAFDKAFKIEQQKFDEKYKTQQQAIETQKINMQYGANNIAQGLNEKGGAKLLANGLVDPVSQKAVFGNFVTAYGLATATALQQVANYKGNLNVFTTRMGAGMNRSTALGLASLLNPNFDQNQYDARSKFLNGWEAVNNPRVPINTSITHLGELKKAGDDLSTVITGGGGIFGKTYGSYQAWLVDHRQDPKAIAFNEAANKVADELAKAYKGGTASATDIGQEKERLLLQIKNSPIQKDAAVTTAVNLLGDYVATYNNNYQAIMGEIPNPDKGQSVIYGNAKDSLNAMKNAGLPIDLNRFGITSTTGGPIKQALATINPDTGLNYTPQEVVTHLQTLPQYKESIQKALDAKWDPQSILDYISTH